MKTLLLVILNLTLSSAFAVSVEDCLKDALAYGSHEAPVTPVAACSDALRASPNKIAVQTTDASIKVFGQNHMIYVEKYTADVLASRELLAGDQTLLTNIKSISINPLKKRLLVIQQGENGTEMVNYNLDFIGNVAPVSMLKSDIAQDATKAELSNTADEIALSFNSLGKIRYYSDQADSRYKEQQSKFIPVILRETSIP